MPATKRKSTIPISVAPKRAKPSTSTENASPSSTYTEAELSSMTKAEIIQHALHLQGQLAAVPKRKEQSPEEINEKADKARQLMVRGISKLMTVNPDSQHLLYLYL